MHLPKRRGCRGCLIVVAVFVFLIAGAAVYGLATGPRWMPREEIDLVALHLWDAVQAQDADAIEAAKYPDLPVSPEEIKAAMPQMVNLIGGAQLTEYRRTSWNSRTQTHSGKQYRVVAAAYAVTTQQGDFVITLTHQEDDDGNTGWLGFNLYLAETYEAQVAPPEPNPVGTLQDWRQFNGVQWALAALSLLTYLFILYSMVHCIRHKAASKGKKVLFALLQLFTLGFSVQISANSFYVGIQAYLLDYSQLLLYPDGSTALLIVLPGVSLLYWYLRHREKKAAKLDAAPPDSEPSPPEL